MGKRYEDHKLNQQIKSTRSLLVIDDYQVRSKMFSQTADILKKIEKLEKDLQDFHSKDQQLYSDWYNLTFRKEMKESEDLRQEYLALASFHNEIVALSEMKNIHKEKAYSILKDEQLQYQNGTDADRQRIDERRKERQEFARKAMEKEERKFFGDFSFEDEEGDESDDDIFADDDDLFGKDRDSSSRVDTSMLKRKDRETYELLKEVSPKKMKEMLSSRNGIELFMEAFAIATMVEDGQLLVKIWDATPAKVRRKVSDILPRQLGESLEDMIEGIRFTNQIFEGQQKLFDDEDSEDHLNDFDESGEFGKFQKDYCRSSKSKVSVGNSLEDDFAIKQVYRKLVRMVHPDSNQGSKLDGKLQDWYGKMWHKIQDAYKAKNLGALKSLELFAIVKLGNLQSLTLDEIKGSAVFFAEELETLKYTAKEVRSHPAWKFSTKRKFDSLVARIRKEFREDLQPLRDDIEGLKKLHAYFDSKISSSAFKKEKKRKRAY